MTEELIKAWESRLQDDVKLIVNDNIKDDCFHLYHYDVHMNFETITKCYAYEAEKE